jgi:hypothetical protein
MQACRGNGLFNVWVRHKSPTTCTTSNGPIHLGRSFVLACFRLKNFVLNDTFSIPYSENFFKRLWSANALFSFFLQAAIKHLRSKAKRRLQCSTKAADSSCTTSYYLSNGSARLIAKRQNRWGLLDGVVICCIMGKLCMWQQHIPIIKLSTET